MFSLLQPGKNPDLVFNGLLLSSALLITGCASTEKRDELQPAIASTSPLSNSASTANTQTSDYANPWGRKGYKPADPLEGFNRPMYSINMFLDRHLIKHIANGYKFITPDFMETGVTNFFTNLKGVNVVLNDALQGKFEQGASDTGRFLTNTTIGVGGLFDVATEFGLELHDEDFGQTLATWGVGSTYLVLPIVGPTTFRDFAGSITVDSATNPKSYVPGAWIVEGISNRANAEGALNFIDEAALDPYVFTRESFLQYRNNLINDGKTDKAAMDELDIDAALDDEIGDRPKSDTKASNGGKSKTTAPTSVSANTTSTSNSSMPNVEEQFATADEKMDQLLTKKHRKRRR